MTTAEIAKRFAAHRTPTNTVKGRASNDPAVRHQRTVDQAGKWVAQTFYGQLLKQMRESPFKNSTFDGGKGGEAFAQMFDQRVAEKLSRGVGQKLVRAMVRKMEGGRAYKDAAAATAVPGAGLKA